MPIKLTDELARAEPPPVKGYKIVFDTEVKGLGLRHSSRRKGSDTRL